jgi:peptide/nickel transport system substrate-binding protein
MDERALSRRDFVKASAGLAAGMALASRAPTAFAGRLGSAAQSNSLSVGMSATMTSLTPLATQGYQWEQMVGYALYDPLIRIEADGSLTPLIAASWDDSNPTQTIIHVRKGVKFQNGQPLTSADVAYSIGVRCDPALVAKTGSRPYMPPSLFKSVEAVDTYTVRVTTTARISIFTGNQEILIIPKDAATTSNLNTQAVGCGAFAVKQFISGSSLSLVPNPTYWAGAPKLASLTFRFFPQVAAEALNLRSGEINALYDVHPLNLKQVTGVAGTKLVRGGTYSHWWIPQMGKAPLNNPAVRRALRYCFDVPQINKAAYAGLATNVWNPFKFYPRQYNVPTKVNVNYDPEMAKSLLAKEGATNITVPILGINSYQDSIVAGQIIEQGFKAAGIQTSFNAPTIQDWISHTYGTPNWEGIAFNAGNLVFPAFNLLDQMVDPACLKSTYTKVPIPSMAALYKQAGAASPATLPGVIRKAETEYLNDCLMYYMGGGSVNLVLPKNLNGVWSNGWGDVRWSNAHFA